jgi:non-specific serine/threonine protein kinase
MAWVMSAAPVRDGDAGAETAPIDAATLPPGREAFGRLVREALAHLYDLPYLQTHPLAALVVRDREPAAAGPVPLRRAAGKRLRQALLEALEALRPDPRTAGAVGAARDQPGRSHHLLTLRYVEGLTPAEVQARLAVGRSEYFREHQRGLDALASLLRERWRLDTPGEAPPRGPEPPPQVPHNLPLQLTSFVGRERELAEVARLVAAHRLVTLTGTGGCGKTRLALQAAAGASPPFPDGIWLVELATVADPALVPQAVAAVVRVNDASGRPLTAALVAALRRRRLLLVLDNCEHLVGACAALADALLRACPHVRVLATSREPLGLAGEAVFRVPSLGVPDPVDAVEAGHRTRPVLAAVAGSESARLFVERAVTTEPRFALSEQNAPAVARICRRLDGLPLALELAAARVRVLPVEELAARLDDRFRLLTGGSRAAPPRQQTLRATLDWSYDLLSEPERALFRRLAVFAGGWTLEAAEAVCADPDGEGIAPADVLDLLTQLLDRSLVVREEHPEETYGAARYRLLETLRQYAAEKPVGAGAGDTWRERHAAFYVSLAEAWARERPPPPPARVRARFAREQGNFRAALRWCSERGRAETGLRLAVALTDQWCTRYDPVGVPAWLEALVADGGAASAGARAQGLFLLGFFAQQRGDYARAQERLEASVALCRERGDAPGLHNALTSLGLNLGLRGDTVRGAACIEESLAFARAQGFQFGIGRCLRDLSFVVRAQGDFARARALLEESVTVLRQAGIPFQAARSAAVLGWVAHLQGDDGEAGGRLREWLAAARVAGWVLGAADCLEWLASVEASTGRPSRAARLFGAAAALRDQTGYARQPADRPVYERDVATTRAALGRAAFAAAWAEGQAMPTERAVAYALEGGAPAPIGDGEVTGSAGGRTAPAEQAAPPAGARPAPVPSDRHLPGGLTAREAEVLGLLAARLSNREIAEALGLSVRTVERHLGNAYAKIGAHDRRGARAYAARHGLAAPAGAAAALPA